MFSSPWFLLVLAGFLEVCWAIGLKYTNGFSKLFPSIFTVIALAGSMYLLARATQTHYQWEQLMPYGLELVH